MVPRLGSWAATVGQVPCAVAVADQGVYLRGDNLIERWGKPQGEKQHVRMLLEALKGAARFVGLMKPWRQGRPHWDFVAELLLIGPRKKVDIEGRPRRWSAQCLWKGGCDAP